MARFVQGEYRRQDYLLPASLDDYVSEDNPVRGMKGSSQDAVLEH
ncbi:hypothetical protein [Novosphingobium aquae]|uniref:Transposase n=1 Tax=Novosphingobium aquae TaxID=3133435 RepID=A0ABU8S923_9SPHN